MAKKKNRSNQNKQSSKQQNTNQQSSNNQSNNQQNTNQQESKPSAKKSKHTGAGKQRRAAKYQRPERTLATDCAASTPGVMMIVMTVMVLIFDREDKRILKKMLGTIAFFVLCGIAGLTIVPEVRASVVTLFADMGTILAGNATRTEGSGRMEIWRQGAEYVSQHPIFGSGCEGITMDMKENLGIGDVHSEPLTYAIYYGIPALLFYLAGLVLVAVRYCKGRKGLPLSCRIAFLGACAYFLSSLVGVAMFYTTPFFFIFMGMADSARGKRTA